MTPIFVDCEAYGHCPALGKLTEFGAVTFPRKEKFHGILIESIPSKENPAVPEPTGREFDPVKVFQEFDEWIRKVSIKTVIVTPKFAFADGGRPVFISDNVAFDWQWINDGFWRHLGYNPFGFSGRRIGDFYAGLTGDFRNANKWKRLRKTLHDHNPVHDALGNVEAFERMLNGER